MRDAGIGRLLVASLHQGIADRLPDRLEFYENWLNPRGLRDGTIGLAPLHAVLSFLRTEGDDYARVTTDGRRVRGAVGGQRAVAAAALGRHHGCPDHCGDVSRSAWRGRWSRAPTPAAARICPCARRSAPSRSRARSSAACATGCPTPLCQFHAAAIARVLTELGIPAQTTIVACQATGDGACRVEIDMSGVRGGTGMRLGARAPGGAGDGRWRPPTSAEAQRVATGRVLIAPFATSRDPRASWLGEGVAVLLADDLNGWAPMRSRATSGCARSTACRSRPRPRSRAAR